MTAVTYVDNLGAGATLDINSPQVLGRSARQDKAVQRSKGGQSNTLLFNSEVFWDVTTELIDKDSFAPFRAFLDDVSDGQIFTFDPYGTVAVPDAPVSVELESNGYVEARTGPRLLSVSFRVREV